MLPLLPLLLAAAVPDLPEKLEVCDFGEVVESQRAVLALESVREEAESAWARSEGVLDTKPLEELALHDWEGARRIASFPPNSGDGPMPIEARELRAALAMFESRQDFLRWAEKHGFLAANKSEHSASLKALLLETRRLCRVNPSPSNLPDYVALLRALQLMAAPAIDAGEFEQQELKSPLPPCTATRKERERAKQTSVEIRGDLDGHRFSSSFQLGAECQDDVAVPYDLRAALRVVNNMLAYRGAKERFFEVAPEGTYDAAIVFATAEAAKAAFQAGLLVPPPRD
jgi:hypothetical protein